MPTINLKRNTVKSVKWNKNQSAEYYNSVGWKTLRNAYISQHPLCERCLQNNIARQADHVHHIKEFLSGKTEADRWSLLLDPENLMSLCVECHIFVHHPTQQKKTNNPGY